MEKLVGWILIIVGVPLLSTIVVGIICIVLGISLISQSKYYCSKCGGKGYVIDEATSHIEAETKYDEYSNSARTTLSAMKTYTYKCRDCDEKWFVCKRKKI